MRTVALDRVDFLPPDRVTDNAAILTLKNLVLEPLCRWQDGQVLPGLFVAWTHDAAGRVWRFRLREGARYHDGQRCVAGDVVDFLEQILAARDTFGMPWPYARYLAGTRIDAPSPAEVRFQAPAPFGDLPDVLTEFHLSRPDPRGRFTVGTGPGRVAAFAPGEAVIEAAGGTTIRVVAMSRAEDRLEAVHAGLIDIAAGLEQCERPAPFDAALRWTTALNTLSVMAYLNAAAGPFTSPAARLAANLALDKQRLVRTLFEGQAVAAATVVSPAHLGFREAGVAPIATDRDRARRLLDTAAIGNRITLRTPTHMPDRAPAMAAAIADELAAIGFDVTIDIQANRPEYAREIGRKQMGDVALFDSSPHSSFRVLDDKISSRSRGTWWQGYADAGTDALIAAAAASLDPRDRAAAYGRCLARLNAAPPWLYLLHPRTIAAARPTVGPIALDSLGVLHLDHRP